MTSNFIHIPVLAAEIISGLEIKPGGHYLDATVGGGGHSSLILAQFPDTKLTAIDRDEHAIAAATSKLTEYGLDRVTFWQGNFAEYKPLDTKFDGIIADLGVSSHQIDTAERGFSFQQEAPLDMRMDGQQSLSATEIINYWDEKQLADIFYLYGEERYSRRIARNIVQKRPFNTTTQLASAIAQSVPSKYRYGRINPATRVFQALRIVVNAELASLEKFLTIAPTWLKPQGRIAIISFHSLEDRIVKQQFRNSSLLKVITKKPLIATEEENRQNPRARSAKLRIAVTMDN